ncbi:MAG: type II toxin-antitoxin system MqsA family antitoxin [Eubacteriales bacterium]|nr:type II toxin-antitoxin system MqsA family antitoxin [Eubacteriales bacterium]
MCFYCGCNTTIPNVTTHVVNYKDCVIVVKNVPCEEREQCGEKYFSDEVMEKLEKIVDTAKQLSTEVFVTDYRNNKVA